MQFQKPSGNTGQRSDLLTIYDVVCAVLNLPDGSKFFCGGSILVPRGRALFGQHQESRPLARSNDIPVLNGFVNTIDWDQNQSDLSDLTQSMRRVTGSPWIGDFRCWTRPEVAVLGADQKGRSLWGRECGGSFNQARLDPHGCALHKWQLNVMDYRVRAGDWHRFYTDGTEQVRNASKVIEHALFYLGSLKCFWSKKNNCCLFERLFKVKNGVFLFGISFFVWDIHIFVLYKWGVKWWRHR